MEKKDLQNKTTFKIGAKARAALRPIVCPCCFSHIAIEHLHFRSGTKGDANDPIIENYKKANSYTADAAGQNTKAYYAPIHITPSEKHGRQWELFEGEYSWPVVKADARRYKLGDIEIHSGQRFIKLHCRERSGLATIGICPYCHHVLPCNFGFNTVVKIALGGLTSNAKTTYLCSLARLGALTFRFMSGETAVEMKFSVNQNEFGNSDYAALKGSATQVGDFTNPLIVDTEVATSKNGHIATENYKLILYDIAGEVAYNQNDTERTELSTVRIQNRAAQCDGVVFMIDPVYLDVVGDRETVRPSESAAVVNQRYQLYKRSIKPCIPMAMAISKSDKIDAAVEAILKESEMHKRFDAINADIKRFLYDSRISEDKKSSSYFRSMHMATKAVINAASNDQSNDLYDKVRDKDVDSRLNEKWFMISALGCEFDDTEDKYSPRHIYDPLIWILLQYMNRDAD